MTAFAIYRLPHEDHATLIRQSEGEPEEFLSCAELNGRRGFVVAPFQISIETVPIEGELSETEYSLTSHLSPLTSSYAIDFASFHAQLVSGTFRKIVLARCADEETPEAIPPMQLFHRACMLYPRMFIALVNTPKSGCWLTATPEILLEGTADAWRTIALAGTMKLEGDQLCGEGESLRWSTTTTILAGWQAICALNAASSIRATRHRKAFRLTPFRLSRFQDSLNLARTRCTILNCSTLPGGGSNNTWKRRRCAVCAFWRPMDSPADSRLKGLS